MTDDYDGSGRMDNRTSTPRPDPTILTTEQLMRELGALRNLLEAKIAMLEALRDHEVEKVQLQFALLDRERVEQKVDTKAAVDAALISQKEAVREQTIASERSIAKSETATSKQLDQLAATFAAGLESVNASVADVKDRITRFEALKLGGQNAYGGIYAAVGFVAVVISIIATGIAFAR